MASKGNKRQARKWLLKQLEGACDLDRLDYVRRIAPFRHSTKLVGVAVALVLYGAVFSLGYFAWQIQSVPYETFVKVSWIVMIPASVVGVFAYMLARNRKEYGVAKDILDYAAQLEGEEGFLWRFEPAIQDMGLEDTTAQEILARSREGNLKGMEPEDYAAVIRGLYEGLQDPQRVRPSEAAQEAVAHNLGLRQAG